MSVQVTYSIDKEAEDFWINDGGKVRIENNGKVLFESEIELRHFWIVYIEMIENFTKKEKKTLGQYFHIDFCLEKAKKDDEIIFSIKCDDKHFQLNPVQLNKKDFLEKSLDAAISVYKELAEMTPKEQDIYGFNDSVKHITELKKQISHGK